MPTQYPMCQVPCVVPALVAAILLASGCSSPGPESQSFSPGASPAAAVAQDDGGLPTKDDGGLGTKDDGGLGTKDDSGLGTKDDSGLGTNDARNDGRRRIGRCGRRGCSAPPDAGNEVGDCFACAERRGCSVPVNACVQSPACVGRGQVRPGVPRLRGTVRRSEHALHRIVQHGPARDRGSSRGRDVRLQGVSGGVPSPAGLVRWRRRRPPA